jgi:hypothetical protein
MRYFWVGLFGYACFFFGFGLCALLSHSKHQDEWVIRSLENTRRNHATHELEQ